MCEELAPRVVHGWYAGALLLESWYTSALLLESTQLLEICNPHSNETEMTHACGALAAICTVHCPCPACRLAIAPGLLLACFFCSHAMGSLVSYRTLASGVRGQTRASCSNLCSSLAKYSGILHTEPLLRQIPRLPVHKFTAVPPALTGVAHRCGPAPTQIKGAKK